MKGTLHSLHKYLWLILLCHFTSVSFLHWGSQLLNRRILKGVLQKTNALSSNTGKVSKKGSFMESQLFYTFVETYLSCLHGNTCSLLISAVHIRHCCTFVWKIYLFTLNSIFIFVNIYLYIIFEGTYFF